MEECTGIPIIVDNEILLGKRLDGTWDLIGFGSLEKNENPYIGAQRELKEESLHIYNIDHIKKLDEYIYTGYFKHKYVKVYLFQYNNFERIQTKYMNILYTLGKENKIKKYYLEHTDFKWFNLDNIMKEFSLPEEYIINQFTMFLIDKLIRNMQYK
jgi:hypothetical protein